MKQTREQQSIRISEGLRGASEEHTKEMLSLIHQLDEQLAFLICQMIQRKEYGAKKEEE